MKVSKEIKLGLYAILAIVILYWGINFLKGEDIFSNHRIYYALYKNTEGLVPTKPVNLNGYQVGVIETIDFIPHSNGVLAIRIKIFEEDLNIPKDTKAQIYSSSLLGDKSIQLFLGNDTELAESGDTLVADIELGIGDEINETIDPIRRKLEDALAALDSTLDLVQGFLNEENQGEFKGTFKSLHATFEHLENTSKGLEEMVDENSARLTQTLKNIESITGNLEQNNEQITHIFANLDEITDSLAKANVAQTMGKLNAVLTQTDSVMTKVNNGEGSLGLLVNDDQLYRNLEDVTESLNRLLLDIKYNPDKYVKVSVFGGGKGEKYSEEEIEAEEKNRKDQSK